METVVGHYTNSSKYCLQVGVEPFDEDLIYMRVIFENHYANPTGFWMIEIKANQVLQGSPQLSSSTAKHGNWNVS